MSVLPSIQKAFTSAANTAKVADLQRNTDVLTTDSGLKTDHGVPISSTDDWLKVQDGTRTGPSLLEDQIAREKIHRFDHERIPERVVHARGAGAHGYFKVYDDRASQFTFAPVLTDPTRMTPIFVRFSTVQGPRGSADTVRDVRGFAVKFYTDEGNWDIVGNNLPVFFIQDAIKFPDFVHAVKPEPQNDVPTGQSAHNNFWDFVGLQPESAHMVMWAMSDRAIPRSFRMMQGFGVNTFTLINKAGERHFVKFHFIPELGVHSLVWDEALKLCGQDPDFHRKDLEEAITNRAYPKWKFAIQIIPESKEHDFEFDILDATKIWPEELVPLQEIGELVLNRVVDEFFPEVEQVAFCTSHVVPGIGFSDDPLLQGRNFSYFDTQISRLGINWEELPINRPVCPMMNFNRDGAMRHRITKSNVNYWPNRHGVGRPIPKERGGYHEHPQEMAGVKQRLRPPKFQEHYKQAQLFFNSLTPYEKAHVVAAFSFELSHCDDPAVYKTYTKLLNNIDFNLARAVATNVGGVVPDKPARENHKQTSKGISQADFVPKEPTIVSRRVAILVADGFSSAEVEAIRALLAGAGAVPYVIGPRRGTINTAFLGVTVRAHHHFEDQRSTLFDALFIPGGAEHAKALKSNGRVHHWIKEAFGHCKAIGAVGEGITIVREAINVPTLKVAAETEGDDKVTSWYGVVTASSWGATNAVTEALEIVPDSSNFYGTFAHEISKHRCYERELDGLTSMVPY